MIKVFIFIIGLLFGSFLLVLGIRLPIKKNVLTDRSRCDNCGKTLPWYSLIPIFSYVFQKGKCIYCHEKIGIENPIMELACAILFLIGYHLYGISYEYFTYLVVISLMLVIFVSDFKYMVIEDSTLIVSFIIAAIIKFLASGIKEIGLCLLSGLALFLFMYVVGLIGKSIFKRESLGGGDIKLAGLIGFIVGYRLGLCVLIVSVFLALPYSVASMYLTKNHEVAYGPFLIGALFIVYVFSYKFMNLINLFF